MLPEISIIVPVYNTEKYVKETLSSILSQSFNNFEVIVVNDGSTDKTEEFIKELELIDKRIKYFRQLNMGPSQARNNGISKAIGKYLMFVDSDDKVDKRYVERLFEKIESGKYDLVTCGYIDESIYGVSNQHDFWMEKEELEKKEFVKCVCRGVGGTLWGKIFRRDIIIENSIKMNPKIYMCEDLLFILEYCLYAKKFSAINEYLYIYNRLNENSITAKLSSKYLDNNIFVAKEIESYLERLFITDGDISKITLDRIRAVVNAMVISEANYYLENKNFKVCKNNIDLVINNKFINMYKDLFIDGDIIGKLNNKFIRNNSIGALLLFNILLQLLRKFKNKALRR